MTRRQLVAAVLIALAGFVYGWDVRAWLARSAGPVQVRAIIRTQSGRWIEVHGAIRELSDEEVAALLRRASRPPDRTIVPES